VLEPVLEKNKSNNGRLGILRNYVVSHPVR